MGGRSEVFVCPLKEVLAHMILAREQDEEKRFDEYALMLHANPMTDGKARERYIRIIEPTSHRKRKTGAMVTDINQLKAAKAALEAEMKG